MKEMEKISEDEYLTCERRHVFFVLMGVAGFFGAFTYSIRGGIFCNAQTANFVLFAMALGNAQWKHALYFLVPMSAYFLGAVLSEALPNSVKKLHFIRWDEAADLLMEIEKQIKRRQWGEAIRLQVEAGIDKKLLKVLVFKRLGK